MNNEFEISFNGIAGIRPFVSIYTDVLNLLGNDYEIERLEPHVTKRRTLAAKILLHYPDLKIVVVFIDPGCELPEDALLTVVGAEEGCVLQTVDGLRVGMNMADAEVIIEHGYQVRDRYSEWLEIEAIDGKSPPILGIQHKDGRVEFIGLYCR